MHTESLDQLAILLIESSADPRDRIPESTLIDALGAGTNKASDVTGGLVQLREQDFDTILYVFGPNETNAIQNTKLLVANSSCSVIAISTISASKGIFNQVIEVGGQDYMELEEVNARSLQRIVLSGMDRYILTKKTSEAKVEIESRETLLRRIFDLHSEAMLVLAPTHQIRSFNPSAARLLDADRGSLIGETFPFTIDSNTDAEFEIPEADGGSKPVRISAVDVVWDGQPSKLVVLKDDSFKRDAALRLEQEQDFLVATLDSVGDAVIMIDPHGQIVRLNREATALTGVIEDQAKGKPIGDVLKLRHPDTGAPMSDPFKDLSRPEFIEAYGKKGLPIDTEETERSALVSVRMKVIHDDEGVQRGGVITLRDVNNRFTSEEEMIENDPSHSINVLAGGIAHDFNNLLAAILGNISVARVKVDPNSDLDQKLYSAEKAAIQARSLSQQLLAVSKGGPPLLEVTTIGELVKESSLFVLRGSNVKCETSEEDGLWAVEADKGQINQVISNLAINADQAMPDGGVIDIRLSNARVVANEVPNLDPGDYVKITLSDTGVGIEPKNMARIFNPYFTTKQDGNGLGLASSQSVVKRHGGAITVNSTLGRGSTFTVYLPRSEAPVEESPAVSEESKNTETPLGQGSGRILVMDDMEPMMLVAGEILTVLGYEVEYTRDGREAIEAYKAAKEGGNPFDAVVFDLTVPGGMGGEEASNILIEYDPDLVAIASSGYTTSNVMSDYEDSAFKAVVPKPYRIKEMSDALQQAFRK